jgi:hypothetical protein
MGPAQRHHCPQTVAGTVTVDREQEASGLWLWSLSPYLRTSPGREWEWHLLGRGLLALAPDEIIPKEGRAGQDRVQAATGLWEEQTGVLGGCRQPGVVGCRRAAAKVPGPSAS